MSDWEVSVTMALVCGSFLMAYIYANTDKVNKFLKILFLSAALLMGASSLAIQDDIISANAPTVNATILAAVHTNYNMELWVFRIVIIAVIVWLIYTGAMNALGKKVEGPEQDG